MYVVSPAPYLEGMLGVLFHQEKKKNFFDFSGLLELKSSFCAGLRIVKTSNSKLDSIRAF